METVKKLTKATRDKKLGNHRVEVLSNFERFYYHSTCVCKVEHDIQRVTIDNGGYGTPSTTRTINAYLKSDYIQDLLYKGYEILDKR